MHKRGISRLSVGNSSSHIIEIKFVGELFVVCFSKFPGGKNSVDKQRGLSRVSFDKTLSHSTEKLRRVNFLSCVSESFR